MAKRAFGAHNVPMNLYLISNLRGAVGKIWLREPTQSAPDIPRIIVQLACFGIVNTRLN
jgi:hypothetical protein